MFVILFRFLYLPQITTLSNSYSCLPAIYMNRLFQAYKFTKISVNLQAVDKSAKHNANQRQKKKKQEVYQRHTPVLYNGTV